MERTLMLIKPDAVRKDAIGRILTIVEEAGFVIRGLRMVHLAQAQAEDFYREHEMQPFFGDLTAFMTGGPIVAVMLEKDSAITDLRGLVGVTDSRKADEGTIRAIFGTDNQQNAVHASDSPQSAARETAFFFSRLDTHPER